MKNEEVYFHFPHEGPSKVKYVGTFGEVECEGASMFGFWHFQRNPAHFLVKWGCPMSIPERIVQLADERRAEWFFVKTGPSPVYRVHRSLFDTMLPESAGYEPQFMPHLSLWQPVKAKFVGRNAEKLPPIVVEL